MNIADCQHLLKQHGATDVEAKDLIDALLEEKRQVLAAGGNIQQLSAQWSERAKNFAQDVKRHEYLKALNLLRYTEASKFVDAIKADGGTGLDGIQALMVGQGKFATGSRQSISAIRQGILASWYAPMMKELESIDGAMDLIRNDKNFNDNIIREMKAPNSTNDPIAAKVGEIFARYCELGRRDTNHWGGNIGKLDGWTPQNHDPYKMMSKDNKAREEWLKFIEPRLDLARTFPDLTSSADIKKALDHVYSNITLGKLPSLPGTGQAPRVSAKASAKLEHSRVLHFKDAEAAIEYHDKYGKGNVFDAMISHLEYEARALSLLKVLGPDPRDTLNKLVQREEYLLRKTEGTVPQADLREAIEKLKKANGPQGAIDNWYVELTGEINIPGNATCAKVMASLRAIENMSKLGGATLSALADPFIKAASMRHLGLSWPAAIVKSIGQYIGYFPKDERLEVARQCGAFFDTVRNEIASRWDDNAGIPGKLYQLQNKFFQWSGLNWITERGKGAYALWLSEHLGEVSHLSLDALDGNRKALLKYHGISSEKWDVMRKMVKEIDGKKYFSPELVHTLSDQDLKPLLNKKYQGNPPPASNPDALNKWQLGYNRNMYEVKRGLQFETAGLMIDETKFAIIEPDDFTRSWMRHGRHPGTFPGELWRAAMQFKGFPLAYMHRVLGGRRWIRAERQEQARWGRSPGAIWDTATKDMPGTIGFVLSSIAFGYAAGVMKDLSKGRDPRSLDKPETWLAAVVQSGGAGIFGDIFLGKTDRFGNSPVHALAGPLADSLGSLARIGGEAIRGDWEHTGHDAARFAMGQAPFVNLWYTRAALDWAFLYHVREMLSPGSLRRSERKMKEEFNQRYLFTPSHNIKRGGGFKSGVNPVLPWTWNR